MKRIQWGALFIAFFLSLYALFTEKQAEETIIFFPLDETASFTNATTALRAQPKKPHSDYALFWTVSSSLNQPAYLRQDISLLFADGRLTHTLSNWKQKKQTLRLEGKLDETDSHFFQAISFHYAEIHRKQTITSAQKMSGDYLYVVASPYEPFTAFRRGKTTGEKEWQHVLTKATADFLQANAKAMIAQLAIPEQNYYHFYLTDLLTYSDQPFPDVTQAKTEKIIGNLWEGLYKNYFLGVKQKDGTVISPIGSTIPLLLISKDYSHLLVLAKMKNGEIVQLRQQISP